MPRTSPPPEAAGRPAYDRLLAFEAILAASPLNVTVYDRDFVVRDVSAAAAELAGRPRAALLGRSLAHDLPAAQLAHMQRVLAGETLEVEGSVDVELSTSERWRRMLMMPVRDGAGAVRAGMTIVVDQTDQKETAGLIEKLAFLDPVTELPNRAMLSMMLGRALSGPKASQRQLALVWLNLYRFKDVHS